jgi:phenylpropionate dioxygenase-like ring-hydroxylating dioxygenase large terminal subunit
MFLRSIWYIAAFSADLRPGERLARRILNEPVVLFRTMSGKIAALADACSHRAMPLSEGVIAGERIRCCYHGLEFGTDGSCAFIPGQSRIPGQASVRGYCVLEKNGIVWIWMGDPALANGMAIAEVAGHDDPQWVWRPVYMHVAANWQLLVDNILDLTHVAYIHARTIGGTPETHFAAQTQVEFDEHQVSLIRRMPNSVPPRTYVLAGDFRGNVDRWQRVDFAPEQGMILRVNVGARDVGAAPDDEGRDNGFTLVNIHGVTPETETSTHYIWSIATHARHGALCDPIFDQIDATIREDEAVLEAQQRRISDMPDVKFVGIASDGAVNHARRLLAALSRKEGSRTPD